MIVEKLQMTVATPGKRIDAECEKKCDGSDDDGRIVIKITEGPQGRNFVISFDTAKKLKQFGEALQNIAHTVGGWDESG